MPPFRRTQPNDPFDLVTIRMADLEQRVAALENDRAPTVPFYDNTNWPAQSVEGQIVIAGPPPEPPYNHFINYKTAIDDSDPTFTYTWNHGHQVPFFWYYNTVQHTGYDALDTNDKNGSSGYNTSAGSSWLRAYHSRALSFDPGYTDAPGVGWIGDYFQEYEWYPMTLPTQSGSWRMVFPAIKRDVETNSFDFLLQYGYHIGGIYDGPPGGPITANLYVTDAAHLSSLIVDYDPLDPYNVWNVKLIASGATPAWTVTGTPSGTPFSKISISGTYKHADFPTLGTPRIFVVSGSVPDPGSDRGGTLGYQPQADLLITRINH